MSYLMTSALRPSWEMLLRGKPQSNAHTMDANQLSEAQSCTSTSSHALLHSGSGVALPLLHRWRDRASLTRARANANACQRLRAASAENLSATGSTVPRTTSALSTSSSANLGNGCKQCPAATALHGGCRIRQIAVADLGFGSSGVVSTPSCSGSGYRLPSDARAGTWAGTSCSALKFDSCGGTCN
jgi:hypothetical protein